MSSSKVFFVQESKFDLTHAAEFGEVIILLDESTSPFNPSAALLELAAKLKKHDYNPEHDYIGFTGQSILMALLFGLVFAGYGDANILLFNARTGKYQSRHVINPYAL